MLKYIVSFGLNNTFSIQIAPFYNKDGEIDWPVCFKHVKDMCVGATVEFAG